MKIERKIAEPRHYGDKRSTRDIKYIVLQTIGNKATTHYHISDGIAIQFVPDDHMSNAVNGAKMNRLGVLHGICTKYNSISIGVPCKMSEEDIQTCLNLVMTLKQRYKINNNDIVRQKDITGEVDPGKWYDDDCWNNDIKNKLIDI